MVTLPLSKLLEMKLEYDRQYASPEEMSARTQACYRNLLAEIREAADRSQGG